jgi:hypothetical protein
MNQEDLENQLIAESSPLVTGDKFLNLTTLSSFLEKHPEDVIKWTDHLKTVLLNNARDSNDTTDDAITAHIVKHDAELGSGNDTCCEICKKTFASTQENPIMTLLCKHKCHTICYLMYQYDHEKSCPNSECPVSMWHIVRELNKKTTGIKKGISNMLIEKYKATPQFKQDIRDLKYAVHKIQQCRQKALRLIKDEKKALLEKHAYALQAIQTDLNTLQTNERNIFELESGKSWIYKYRRLLRKISNRYNLSFYELNKYKIIKVSYNIRRTLDNNVLLSRYFKRIVLMPGSKKWF